mmetsp:Transcript_36427/g.60635  ORF Transcript_36427/g.60635 Transcript_36427/m.60635 type:complete len:176 (-) Transcript_36427:88-615(-)
MTTIAVRNAARAEGTEIRLENVIAALPGGNETVLESDANRDHRGGAAGMKIEIGTGAGIIILMRGEETIENIEKIKAGIMARDKEMNLGQTWRRRGALTESGVLRIATMVELKMTCQTQDVRLYLHPTKITSPVGCREYGLRCLAKHPQTLLWVRLAWGQKSCGHLLLFVAWMYV